MLTGSEGVVSGYVHEVACVIKGEYPDISASAYLEAVDAAIGCYDPGRLFGSSVNRSHQMKCQKADRAGMREYRYSLTGML